MADVSSGREARWRRWLLVVSLGLNLIVIGLVAGAVLRGGPPGHAAPRFDLTVGPLTRALDEGDRREMRAALERNRPFQAADRAAMRQDFSEMVTLLKADRFDADQFRAVMTRQRARLAGVQEVVLDEFIQRIEAMSPDARAAFADRLRHELREERNIRDGRRN